MTLPRPLLWMPRSAATPGGHLVQLHETARALADLGCEVKECRTPDPSLSGIDIVHGFDMSTQQIRWCREQGVPVVISTIYWDLDYRYDGPPHKPGPRALLGRMARWGVAAASLRGRAALIEACMAEVRAEFESCALLASADLLLPNSQGEANSLHRDGNIKTAYRIVPNGVDPARYSPGEGNFGYLTSSCSQGGQNLTKTSWGYWKHYADTGLKVVLAYVPHRDHAAYLNRCKEAAAGWAELVEDPTPEQLLALYRSARVHVLPSWFETTGLVSLEAGLCGCNIVSTDRGHASEYLVFAWYCDPADPPRSAHPWRLLGTVRNAGITPAHTDLLHLGARRTSHTGGLSGGSSEGVQAQRQRLDLRRAVSFCCRLVLMLSGGSEELSLSSTSLVPWISCPL